MREFIYAVAGLAGSTVLTGAAVVFPVPALWRRVLYVAAIILGFCALWLLIDFAAERGLGMWLGLNLPLWARGLVGAVVGAVFWIALTAYHSNAQNGGCGTIKFEGGSISGFRTGVTVPSCGNVDVKGTKFENGDKAVEMRSPAPTMGDNNTFYGNAKPPQSMGSGNTIVGPTDANGNTVIQPGPGGLAVGSGAHAGPGGISIGAGAGSGTKPTE